MIDTSCDTICAIATAPGMGGIAVIRVSGPDALRICSGLWKGKPLQHARSHTATFGEIVESADGLTVDQAVATVFRGPHSFTGEDTVELSVHGSPFIQQRLLGLLHKAGARLAQPGEFTRRAFANGRIDLVQAEAVADLINARSRAAHDLALNHLRGGLSTGIARLRAQLVDLASLLELELDFSEEDVEFASRTRLLDLSRQVEKEITRLHASFDSGDAILHGIPVAIVGPVNAGKSSLMNALLADERAIVSAIPGTTRDTITDTLSIGPYQFRLTDTAGLRYTTDTIEALGIDRSRRAAAVASILLLTNPADAPRPWAELTAQLDHGIPPTVILVNTKTDIGHTESPGCPADIPAVDVSTMTDSGLDQLRAMLLDAAKKIADTSATADTVVTNARHAAALADAGEAICRVIAGLTADIPADLIAQDLRQALHHLGTITGTITTPEILTTIFSCFCIGK